MNESWKLQVAALSPTSEITSLPPLASSVHTKYVDNLIALGPSQHDVTNLATKAAEALRESGLIVHEQVSSAVDCAELGWAFAGPAIFCPCHRCEWRARLTVRQLLRVGRCSGKSLEKIIGHLSFIALGRRGILSVLGSCFAFIQDNYGECRILLANARHELSTWDALAPLIVCNLSASWHLSVHVVDAS